MKILKDCINVEIHNNNLVCTDWLRSLTKEEYEKSLLDILSIINKVKASCWLVQASVFTAPDVLGQKWTIEFFYPLLLKSNIKKIAFVLPGDYMLHMLGESMTQKVYKMFGKKILIDCFTRVDHARYWLTNPDELENAYANRA